MRYLLALCFTLTGAAWTFAQSDTATLTVNVADASSAIVPGATVAVRHLDTNAIRELVSDEEGRARFAMLPPGVYEVVASLSGFKPFRSTAVRLQVAQAASIEARLEAGDLVNGTTR